MAGDSDGQAARSHDHGVRGHGRLRDGAAAHPILRLEHGCDGLHRRSAHLGVLRRAAGERAELGEGVRSLRTPTGGDRWLADLGARVCRLRTRRDALDPAPLAHRAGRRRRHRRRAAGVRRGREQARGSHEGTRLALRRDQRRSGRRSRIWFSVRAMVGTPGPRIRRGRVLRPLDALRLAVPARIEGDAPDRRASGPSHGSACGRRRAGAGDHSRRRAGAPI